jgi:hypothetical protein
MRVVSGHCRPPWTIHDNGFTFAGPRRRRDGDESFLAQRSKLEMGRKRDGKTNAGMDRYSFLLGAPEGAGKPKQQRAVALALQRYSLGDQPSRTDPHRYRFTAGPTPAPRRS